jgi:hypothetical protein
MAALENKRSSARTQPTARKKRPATRAQPSAAKHRRPSPKPHRNPKKARAKKRERLPPSLRFTETKRGKTTIRRYRGRTFYRFAEAAGKPLDLIEFFTSGGYHSIDVRFQDKTAMHFVIEPGLTLETEYADWKTGNWRRIKRWPLIRGASLNS